MSEPGCFVCLSDSLSGGAATACNRLGMGLVNQGITHQRWHFSRPGNQPFPCIELDGRGKRPPLERFIKNISRPAAAALRRRRHEHALRQQIATRRPGCVNLHNIHDSGLNHDSLHLLPADMPLTWTLHDRWPFATEAFQWQDQPGSAMTRVCADGADEEAAKRRRNRFFASRPDLCLIAPSRWLFDEARNWLPDHRIEHIPYGLPTEIFTPMDVSKARETMGLDPSKIWLGFASTWGNARKGADLLPRALHNLTGANLALLIWGESPACDWPAGITVHEAGTVSDPLRLRTLYAACDVFLCPSRADNLPNTVLESLACGTPCAGTRVGGIPDMARPGRTGWLMPGVDAEGVAAGIRQALDQRHLWPQIRKNCRDIAIAEYSLEMQARAYSRLHQELMEHHLAAALR